MANSASFSCRALRIASVRSHLSRDIMLSTHFMKWVGTVSTSFATLARYSVRRQGSPKFFHSRPARGPVVPRKASSGFRRGISLFVRTRVPTRASHRLNRRSQLLAWVLPDPALIGVMPPCLYGNQQPDGRKYEHKSCK
jgi:hypothetical protein